MLVAAWEQHGQMLARESPLPLRKDSSCPTLGFCASLEAAPGKANRASVSFRGSA